MLWKELTNYILGDKNSYHLVLKKQKKKQFYWNTAIRWCSIFAFLYATTAKVSSCIRHSIAHKAYNIFYLDLCKKEKLTKSFPKETEVHRAQWWEDHASQSGEKSRGWWGSGEHWGGAERKGWGREVCRGERGSDTKRGAGQQDHLGGKSASEGSTSHLEIIPRNLQTWVQILICIKQILKLLFGFVCLDGPESQERRC